MLPNSKCLDIPLSSLRRVLELYKLATTNEDRAQPVRVPTRARTQLRAQPSCWSANMIADGRKINFERDNVFALVHRGMIKSLLQSWWKRISNLQNSRWRSLKLTYLKLLICHRLIKKNATVTHFQKSFFPWSRVWDKDGLCGVPSVLVKRHHQLLMLVLWKEQHQTYHRLVLDII